MNECASATEFQIIESSKAGSKVHHDLLDPTRDEDEEKETESVEVIGLLQEEEMGIYKKKLWTLVSEEIAGEGQVEILHVKFYKTYYMSRK